MFSSVKANRRIRRYENLVFDLERRVLLRDGSPVALAPRPTDVLAAILEADGRIVSYDELIRTVWRGETPGETALPFAVNQLRQALKPYGDFLIQNIPKKGYRASADWIVPAGPNWKLRMEVLCGILIAALATAIVAVLPAPVPRVLSYIQLTDDGSRKFGPLLSAGGRIYFSRATPDGARLSSIPADGGTPVTVTTPLGTDSQPISVGPDGSRLLLAVPGQSVSIWEWEPGHADAHLVSQRSANVAAWNPTGDILALGTQGTMALLRHGSVYAEAAVGGQIASAEWLPDGAHVRMYVSDPAKGLDSHWEMDTTGLVRQMAANDGFTAITYGTWVAGRDYSVYHTRPAGELLWVRESPRGGHDWKSSGRLTEGGLRWSWPARSVKRNRVLALGEKTKEELVRFLGANGEHEPYLGGLAAMDLDYSRDGSSVVYSRLPGHNLFIARSNGTSERQLTYGRMEARQPHFSPDGRTIAFMGRQPGDIWRIYTVSVAGGKVEILVRIAEDQGVPTWSTDGRYLVYGELSGRKGPDAMAIHAIDLAANTITTLPGSYGLWTARCAPLGGSIVALTADSTALMLFNQVLGKWEELAHFAYLENPTWTSDGRYIYGNDAKAGMLYRVRLADRAVEKVANLTGYTMPREAWFGITADGYPIGLRAFVLQDVYALDCEFPR